MFPRVCSSLSCLCLSMASPSSIPSWIYVRRVLPFLLNVNWPRWPSRFFGWTCTERCPLGLGLALSLPVPPSPFYHSFISVSCCLYIPLANASLLIASTKPAMPFVSCCSSFAPAEMADSRCRIEISLVLSYSLLAFSFHFYSDILICLLTRFAASAMQIPSLRPPCSTHYQCLTIVSCFFLFTLFALLQVDMCLFLGPSFLSALDICSPRWLRLALFLF
jgi:hypothetical protein